MQLWCLPLSIAVLTAAALGCGRDAKRPAPSSQGAWQDSFDVKACTWSTRGENRYFVLRPGYQIVLGKRHREQSEQVLITVLEDTERVDEVETRVVEEQVFQNAQLIEISRDFFAVCTERNDVFHFGEDVDIYEHGTVVAHTGAWRAGRNGARAGLKMPATPPDGLRYYEEIAPGKAMDRVQIERSDDMLETTAGTFSDCLKVIESSPLEPGDKWVKRYAPGIGLIQDEDLRLIRYGHAEPGPVALPDGGPGESEGFTEVEIDVDELPQALARRIRELYPTGRIHEVKREIHPGARVVYAVEVLVGPKQYDVVAGWRSGRLDGGPRELYVLARVPSSGSDKLMRAPGPPGPL
jgi:hypothetical protein